MTEEEVNSLFTVLKDRLAAEVTAEPVAPGRYRFAIVSPQFKDMPDLDRQDRVWDLIDATIPRALSLDISLILAFAPDELGASTGTEIMGLLEKVPDSKAR